MSAVTERISVQDLDALIREGKLNEARLALSQIEAKKVGRDQAAPLASLARRLELFGLALKILNPIVRSANPLADPPNIDEELEYGIVLMKVGALEEARRILSGIDAKARPDSLLFLAMSFFSEWNYGAAVPLLREFIASEQLPPYRRLVGKVNLAASLIIEGELLEASQLLQELIVQTESSGAELLNSNCLELSAQLAVRMKEHDKAERLLRTALGKLRGSNSTSELYTRKWLAINDSYRSKIVVDDLFRVRSEAMARHQWEVVRDCDFHAGLIAGDDERILHCYFGSPYPAYRKKILESVGRELRIPDFYLYTSSGAVTKETDLIVDLEMGMATNGKSRISAGSHLHGFLVLLSHDFYKPLDLVTAFCRLAPDEYYNPESATNRIYQLANRLKSWFAEANLPIHLESVEGRYRLDLHKRIALRIPREFPDLSVHSLQFRCLERIVGSEEFTAKRAREELRFSFGSMNALINWGLENSRLQKLGSGSATRYRITAC